MLTAETAIIKTIPSITSLVHKGKPIIVKALAIDLGLGGVYAEEACLNIDKNKKPSELDEKDFDYTLEAC